MSDYEYDTGATRLVISEGLNIREDKKLAIVSAEHLEGANIAVAVQAEDAPAVALAVLEAAGAPDNRFEDPDVVSAWHALNAHRIRREEDEERESEDAKALEFRKVIFPGIRPGASITPKDRDNYRAARKFFEEA